MRNITAEVWTGCSDNLMSLVEYPACFTNRLELGMKNCDVNSLKNTFQLIRILVGLRVNSTVSYMNLAILQRIRVNE